MTIQSIIDLITHTIDLNIQVRSEGFSSNQQPATMVKASYIWQIFIRALIGMEVGVIISLGIGSNTKNGKMRGTGSLCSNKRDFGQNHMLVPTESIVNSRQPESPSLHQPIYLDCQASPL